MRMQFHIEYRGPKVGESESHGPLLSPRDVSQVPQVG